MNGIDPTIYQELNTVLLRCGPFANSQELRSIFINSPIYTWIDNIPTGNTPKQRVANTIEYLYGRQDSRGNNGLILFLETLSSQVPSTDHCHKDLIDITAKIKSNLTDSLTNNRAIIPDEVSITVRNIWRVKCPDCGIEFLTGYSDLLQHCTNCFSVLLKRNLYTAKLQPSNIVAFSVSKAQLQQIVIDYLCTKEYVPDNIFNKTSHWVAHPIYLPYYIFEL